VKRARKKSDWGMPPWKIEFRAKRRSPPEEVDVAIVGGGLTGLATAAWLRHVDRGKSVALFEATRTGGGSSGRTGGIALPETATGDLPGLGDVLGGYERILRTLGVKGEFERGGVYELEHRSGEEQMRRGRSKQRPYGREEDSQIRWTDNTERENGKDPTRKDGVWGTQNEVTLQIAREVTGGSVNPGKVLAGLARAAERAGAIIFEGTTVTGIADEKPLRLRVEIGKKRREICAKRVLIATNAMSLELSGMAYSGGAELRGPKFTLAVATEPLSEKQLAALGLESRRPFYTVDLPYLWGRVLRTNNVIFGSGLVHVKDSAEFSSISVHEGEAARLLDRLCERVRRLHTVLRDVKFTHRWGGPMLIGKGWKPVFRRHVVTPDVLVLGAYSGHGVALSVYLGRWAAEVLLGQRRLPEW